jgi:hypothetical protein
VSVLLLLLRLMQDDDDDVREAASTLVCTSQGPMSSSGGNENGLAEAAAGRGFTVVEECCLQALAVPISKALALSCSEGGSAPARLIAALSSLLCGKPLLVLTGAPADLSPSLGASPEDAHKQAMSVAAFEALVPTVTHLVALVENGGRGSSRLIFEAEQANLFASPSLLCGVLLDALCAFCAVEGQGQGQGKGKGEEDALSAAQRGVLEFLRLLSARTAELLLLCVDIPSSSSADSSITSSSTNKGRGRGGGGWIAGPTYQKDIFLFLSVGLSALSKLLRLQGNQAGGVSRSLCLRAVEAAAAAVSLQPDLKRTARALVAEF